MRSPSSFNLQPSLIILVQSDEMKQALSKEAMLGPGNQFRTRDASAVAVFLADLEPTKRIDRIYQLEKNHRNPNYLNSLPMVSSFLIGEGHAATMIKGIATDMLSKVQPMPLVEPVQAWGYKNTSLLAQTFVYAAESNDLATSMMEGFDSRRVQEILRIPDRYAIPLVVAVGYEYEDPETFESTPRLDISEAVFGETFGEPLELEDEQQPGEDDEHIA
jgi:nitroreductase